MLFSDLLPRTLETNDHIPNSLKILTSGLLPVVVNLYHIRQNYELVIVCIWSLVLFEEMYVGITLIQGGPMIVNFMC